MNPGGDAAEQVVRLSLEGIEVAAKISGSGARNIGLLLYATLKQEQKTKGKARLTSMLKSGKELKVFTIRQEDLKKFSQESKRYGVLYCVLKDRNDPDPKAAVDVIARAEDASKISRITERFRLATVDQGTVVGSVQREKEAMFPKASDQPLQQAQTPAKAGRDAAEQTGQASGAQEEATAANPSLAKTDNGHLSAPDLKQEGRSDWKTEEARPSVKEKLAGYRAQAVKAKRARELSKRQTLGREASGTVRKAVKSVPVRKAPGKDR